MEILRLENVTKKYGNMTVIDDLSFTLSVGSLFGFVGKNGAGKTTTMKMICGFLKPSSGSIYVCGEKVSYGDTKTNRFIGYLPDVPSYYSYMTPMQYLTLCGRICGLKKKELSIKAAEMLKTVGLEKADRKIGGFSRGMKQRLGIAQALLNNPRLLICDEPTSALDPIGRKEVLEILDVIKERTTVLFSTHILSDVERICDAIGVINGGKFALKGNLKEIRGKYNIDSVKLELENCSGLSELADKVRKLSYVSNVTAENSQMTVKLNNIDESKNMLLEFLLSNNVSLRNFQVMEHSLENLILEAIV